MAQWGQPPTTPQRVVGPPPTATTPQGRHAQAVPMATATTPQHTRPPSAASTPAVASTPRRRRMSSSSDDSSKAKLGRILADILRVGCVQGFKYMHFHLRGREELIVKILNDPRVVALPSPASSFSSEGTLPRNQDSLMLSARTQRKLSGYGYINVGLPPASPSEREIMAPDPNQTIFLLAAYARYNCPFVWVRSSHERLIRMTGSDDTADAQQKDNPLKLKSTSAYESCEVKVWDIVAELVSICCSPPPANPFSVDHAFFERMEPFEAMLATSATVNLLNRILDSGMHDYDDKIAEDIHKLMLLHFQTWSQTGSAPQTPRSATPQ